jgi:outer membrane receptor protein involved in Fe transport
MKVTRSILLFVLAVLMAAGGFAQTTANLTGTVTSQGAPLPGVTVTVTSPNLQGNKTAVTGETGGYSFAALPPGAYTVQFELSGLKSVTKTQQLQLSQTARVDADLKVEAVAEAITVTAAAPSVLETPQVATNLTLKEVERLPVARNQVATALLAPGVNGNTLSANQFAISGSPGYDNLVLVNGVVVTENVRSQSRPLYIEDAIQETTVLTGSISAEYGRFTGGVINTITKSGGNQFTGSLRDSLSNAAWAANIDPFPVTRRDKINPTYEATLGGYILRDRLWFFGAGRMAKTDTPLSLLQVPASTTPPIGVKSPLISYSQGSDEKRYEGKLTAQLAANHNIVGSYFKIDSKSTNTRFQAAIYDAASLTDRTDPESLYSAHYNGTLTSNFLLEGQYSKRKQAFIGSGAKFTDIVRGTLLLDRGNGNARFNAATFCGVCDTETRNNNEYMVKGNYFFATRALGTHNFVGGLDRFAEQRYANNHQSGSDYRLFVNGTRYANGQIYPIVSATSASGANTFIRWTPIFVGANASNVRTDSAFVNDRWDFNSHFSFNVGVRFDKNHAVDGNGFVSSDDSKFTPRLSVLYDLKGDGRHRLSASYAQYASRIVEGIAASNATAGTPGTIDYRYTGPSFNTTTLDTPLPDVVKAVFDWFNSKQGGATNTAAGNLRPNGAATVPGYSTYFSDALASPFNDEWTVGYGAQVGHSGFAKVDIISRDWKNFYATSVTPSTRHITNSLGIPVDLGFVYNSDAIKRTYRGVQFQGRWNPGHFQSGMNYTWSKTRGNDEGETAGSGPVSNVDPAQYYPQLNNYARYLPIGYLSSDQRHRARAWVGYDFGLGPIGNFNVSVLENYDSGLPYSAVAAITTTSYTGAPDPSKLGYNQAPNGQYYFSDRGQYRTENISSTNLALRYSHSLLGRAEVFVQGDLLNAFNRQGFTAVNTTVNTSLNSANFAAFNPFTGTPIECPQYRADGTATPGADCKALGANFQKGVNFGKPTSAASYQTPRTYRFSAGIRF